MTKQETIQVLQSIEDRAIDFPNMTECDWVAIAAAKRHLTEEPVSEELEKAADEYADGENPTCPCEECLIKTFKAGANWQKEQDQETIELAEDHAMLAGMEKMKEQMMAEAIDAQVLENYDGKIIKYDETILDEKLSDCKVFDKVKVIVIKE